MKIVMKNVLDKIDEAIDKYGSDSIIRIELDNIVFRELLNTIKMCPKALNNVFRINLGGEALNDAEVRQSIEGYLGEFRERDRTGAYIVYKGVCIQCHIDHQGFEVIRETIVQRLERMLSDINKDDVKWIEVSQQEFDELYEMFQQGRVKADCKISIDIHTGEIDGEYRGIAIVIDRTK